eukprot:4654-Heterococcus_DN1.PRE.3
MVSPFFKLSANTLLLGALVTALSLYCHAGLWRGVAVAGAGDASVDGYYYWIGLKGATTYAQNVHTKIRLPDAYSLSWLQPQMQLEEPGRSHILQKDGNGRWTISYQGAPAKYTSSNAGPAGTVAPPAAGWTAKGAAAKQGSAPAVTAAWRLQPAAAAKKKRGKSRTGRAASGLATLLAMPGTTLLLCLNLWVAFLLWSRKVDPGTVAVSYDAVVSDREYW